MLLSIRVPILITRRQGNMDFISICYLFIFWLRRYTHSRKIELMHGILSPHSHKDKCIIRRDKTPIFPSATPIYQCLLGLLPITLRFNFSAELPFQGHPLWDQTWNPEFILKESLQKQIARLICIHAFVSEQNYSISRGQE